MDGVREKQLVKANAEVVAIMNHIRQRYEEMSTHGTAEERTVFAEMFSIILQNEVTEFAADVQMDAQLEALDELGGA